MTETPTENIQKDVKFIGEVSNPFCSLKITKGLVEFKVRYIQGNLLPHKNAQLISESGEVYPVMVRGISIMHPSQDPRDFLVRVDGIDIEKAKEMRTLIQELVPEGTTFVGAIIDFQMSSTQSDVIEVRVRPQPYSSLHRGEAQVINQANEARLVTIRSITSASPSVTLGRFGDLIMTIEGISFEDMKNMQQIVQEQNKATSPGT